MVKPADRGHRYAMKACKMLFPIAKQHDLKVLQIVTAADNLASAKTCELLGKNSVIAKTSLIARSRFER